MLPVLSKILERLVHSRVMTHLTQYNYLTAAQYGFRAMRSTEGALQDLCTSIYDIFEERQYCLGVFLDLSKAFDTLGREILFTKLTTYRLTGMELIWFKSYFRKREQYVFCNNKASSRRVVQYGIPQGSILGPLMFVIYMNDITYASRNLKYVLYADDTNVFMTSSNIKDLYNRMNSELISVKKWIRVNRLTLNIGKTIYVLFHRQQKTLPRVKLKIKMGSYNIDRVQGTKFLGVIIDEHLIFKPHMALILCRLSKFVPIFYKIRNLVNLNCLILLYNALVLPNLMYCYNVCECSNARTMKPLIVMQKRIIRVICHAAPYAHTEPLFQFLHMLRLDQLSFYTRSNFIYKSLNELNSCRFFTYVTNAYNTRRCVDRQLQLRICHSEHSKRSITYSGVKLWNVIPRDIRQAVSYCSFKYRLKRYLTASLGEQ